RSERLDGLPPDTVLDLTLAGAIDLAGEQRLKQALSVVQGRCRSLQVHRAGLRLEPTDEDMAALQADGYVGDVIAQLRQRQDAAAGEPSDTARDALAILARRLERSAADMAALRADGYVGDEIARLRQRQDAAAGEPSDTAREALAILARLLGDRAGERA